VRKYLSLLLVVILLATFSSTVFAAVGGVVFSPEEGWKRYEQTEPNLNYTGTWLIYNDIYETVKYTKTVGDTLLFKFKGTKFRIIDTRAANRADGIKIEVDGVAANYNSNGTTQYSTIMYEKLGLVDSVHTVVITGTSTALTSLDAIDLNKEGYFVDPNDFDRLIDLVQGANNLNSRINVVNYQQARSIKESEILPYGYSQCVK
jgi:hypothetical protein